jgi:hypothetical protein
MPGVGLEPTRIAPADFKSAASASSATPAVTEAILILLEAMFKIAFLQYLCTSPPLSPSPFKERGRSKKEGGFAPLLKTIFPLTVY